VAFVCDDPRTRSHSQLPARPLAASVKGW
jgi:hypothetical protein